MAFILIPVFANNDAASGGQSFLGGQPQLPPDVPWPRASSGKPMTFLGQIDLGELPPSAGAINPLPEAGALSFFIEQTGSRKIEHCVLYHPETATLVEAKTPADLVGISNSVETSSVWWKDRFAALRRTSYPRTPVAAHCLTFSLDEDQLLTLAQVRDSAAKDRAKNIEELGAEVADELEDLANAGAELGQLRTALEGKLAILAPKPPKGFLSKLGVNWIYEPSRVYGPYFDLDTQFPWTWLFIEYFALHMMDFISADSYNSGYPGWLGAELATEAALWLEKARAHPASMAPAISDVAAFRDWQHNIVNATGANFSTETADSPEHTAVRAKNAKAVQSMLVSSLIQATRELLPLGAASGLPTGFLVEFEEILTSTTSDSSHQMLGPGAVRETATNLRDQILLMQFLSDRRLGWMWGDLGFLQFWITPGDLRARNFANVKMTMESA